MENIFVVPKCNSEDYNLNIDWNFKRADAFPLDAALEKHKDINGRYFFEKEYIIDAWENVSLPHTFNDTEGFTSRAEDSGARITRTFSFYRKSFVIPQCHDKKKVIIEFEGIRQASFVYVNGKMVGFYEAGVAPFAFDITQYVEYGEENLLAVAADNTSSRMLAQCTAETPNKEDVQPGYYSAVQTKDSTIPENRRGLGFLWNCNDFNPTYGGITKNVRLHIKDRVYQTLPIYSNLRTKGVYVFASDFNIKSKSAVINVEAEIKNETDVPVKATLEVNIVDHKGDLVKTFCSERVQIEKSTVLEKQPLCITPEDAYIYDDASKKYIPVEDETKVNPTCIDSFGVTVVKTSILVKGLRFWSCYDPYLYDVYTVLKVDDEVNDVVKTTTGFRKVSYDKDNGMFINDEYVWLTGYAQRSTNEWAAIGVAPDWLKDFDASLIRQSNANFIRWMHVAACPADIRSCDKYGIVCVQPAGDKERESFGRQWDQRVELMRDIIIYFRNNPSIVFWETGNNAVSKEHMREMTQLKRRLDPTGGRYMGCRTICTEEVIEEAEFVGTMLNRFAGRFESVLMPIVETEYLRDEAPRRVWDDFSPPDYDYKNIWLGRKGKKQVGGDMWDQTAEDFAYSAARSYHEFFNDRVGGASGRDFYSTAAALCWTDSAQHGRQSGSENARMSGRVDAVRVKKQNFFVFKTLQNPKPDVLILGHWNYPQEGGDNYKYEEKEYDGTFWIGTGKYSYRDPKNKTVFVIGNGFVAKVGLFINDRLVKESSEPEFSFIYRFEGINITESGKIEAKAYDMQGNIIAQHCLETVGEAAGIKLTLHTGSKGLIADGSDVAFFDVEVVDDKGRLCPLNYEKINFKLEGEAKFLGGYNSGRFDGYGKDDSVIHKDYVYAECGNNRVFIRSTRIAGNITLTASMDGLNSTSVGLTSKPMEMLVGTGMTTVMPQESKPVLSDIALESSPDEALKETTEVLRRNHFDTKVYYKVTVNRREVDFKEKRVYEQTGVFGPAIPVLEAIKAASPDSFTYSYDDTIGELTLTSGDETIVATVGRPPLIVNGEENLMNGEPEIKGGEFFMEINTLVSYIKGIKAELDENILIYRITT